MTGRRVLPPVLELKRMREEGMSLRQIAEQLHQRTGEKVTPAAVSAALSRAGYAREQLRYDDLIPWRVAMPHQRHMFVRMLRLEARRRRGLPVEVDAARRLDEFIEELHDKRAVIHYNPDYGQEGFYAVPARPGIDTDLIRVPQVGPAAGG